MDSGRPQDLVQQILLNCTRRGGLRKSCSHSLSASLLVRMEFKVPVDVLYIAKLINKWLLQKACTPIMHADRAARALSMQNSSLTCKSFDSCLKGICRFKVGYV